MSLRLVVFDWDGTLTDSQHTIVEAMTAAFAAHGLPAPAAEAIRRVVGLPLAEATFRLGAAEAEAVADAYRAAHAEIRQRPGWTEPLFPGVPEILDLFAARRIKLGIATGKSRRGLAASLAAHGLRERFATLQTSDDGPGKPHPHMLHAAMAEAGARPAETAMVGDTTFDVEMAKAAGALAIGAAWGYHGVDELRAAGADAIATSLADLPALLDRLGDLAR
jgi:phosphoglycolate phosphatase